jgi:arginine utilization regulatory protein
MKWLLRFGQYYSRLIFIPAQLLPFTAFSACLLLLVSEILLPGAHVPPAQNPAEATGAVMAKNEDWHIDYVDSLAIVDKNFKVVYANGYNPRFDDEILESFYLEYINKNFYEVYPQLRPENSTMYSCIKNNRIMYRNQQMFRDFKGRVFNTRNLTIPIVREGEVVGAIELSKDLTSISDQEEVPESLQETAGQEAADIVVEDVTFDEILTVNSDMLENIRQAKIYALSPSPMLIFGETGTGKELFVQAMANHADIDRRRLVTLNCAAVPRDLFESILFGSVRGAFTGAVTRVGLFEQADGGMILLDELNTMPLETQAKLLRVLQDGRIRPLGSDREKQVTVKMVAAMNQDPMEAIARGELREDLFFRLSSNLMQLIPLRERREDISLYVDHFIKIFNTRYGKQVKGISSAMMDLFMTYDFKGNVRELRHILEATISTARDSILTIREMPLYMKKRIDGPDDQSQVNGPREYTGITLPEILEKTEREIIIKVLGCCRGNLTKAAERLGIPRQTLKYRMTKLKISKDLYK